MLNHNYVIYVSNQFGCIKSEYCDTLKECFVTLELLQNIYINSYKCIVFTVYEIIDYCTYKELYNCLFEGVNAR